MHLPIARPQRHDRFARMTGHRSRHVVDPQVAQTSHLRIACVPEVDTCGEANCKKVGRRPVEQVEVVVILKSRRVQHFDRLFAYFPLTLLELRELVAKLQPRRLSD